MKNRILYVIPECYVDTNLIEYLLDAHVNHQHSCTKVIGNLKNSYRDKFAVGIIDRDKNRWDILMNVMKSPKPSILPC